MNNKKPLLQIALLAILMAVSTLTTAQVTPNYQWAKKIGGTLAEQLYDIQQDASGNIFMTGYFSGTCDFDPSAATANLTTGGNVDMFVAKYDAAGNYLWAIRAGSTLADQGYKMAIDASGNVVVIGSFIGTVDFDPSASTASLTAPGSSTSDIFIAKYSAAGAYMWAKRIGGTSGDVGKCIIQDGSGNLFISGLFASTADFDPSAATANLTSFGLSDAFIAEYDASGNYIFARKIGGTTNDQGTALTFDNSGNLVLAGAFSGTADFDPSAAMANLVSAGSNDNFIAKYSATGTYLWAVKIGGTLDEQPSCVLNDASDNIYLTGYFNGTSDFDPSGSTANLTSAGSTDIYLAEYTGTGTYVWAEKIGGTSGDAARNMLFDGSGNILLTGSFGATCDFDPSAAPYNLTSLGNTDIFMASYSASTGAFNFARKMGAGSADLGYCLLQTVSGNILFAGYFANTVDFDPSAATANQTSAGNTDNFFASYVLCPVITASLQSQTDVNCNGSATGSATVTASGGSSFTYAWAPSGGTAATASNLVAGTYTCTITNQCGNSSTVSVTITQPPALTGSLVSQSDLTCNNGANGAATVSASGGTGAYTYAWTPTGGSAAASTTLSAGTSTCTITDANGCTATQTVLLTEPAALVVTASGAATICAGITTSLSANSTGGTGASTLAWMPGALSGTPVSVSPSATTTYTVTATDANGCTATDNVAVTVNALPNLSVTSNPSNGNVCYGSQATLTASGASSYSWTGGITNAVAFTPTVTTTYTVTGTSAAGCTASTTSLITVSTCGPASTLPCGQTYASLNTNVSASNVVGAVNYRFSFYNNTTGVLVAQRTQASRTLNLINVSGLHLNTTYKWSVAVDMGSGFGSESNLNCTMTLAAPTAVVSCGVVYSNLNTYSAIPTVYGSSGYRFTFYDNVTNAVVAQVTQASNYIYFNTIPALHYGNTYKWTVAVQYIPSTGGTAFGPESSMNCTITFNAPQATVPCNGTWSRSSGYTAITTVQGAIQYRFTFYNTSTGAVVAQRTQTSNYIYFNQVTGISAGQTYNWGVEVQYNNGSGNVFGPTSTLCPITFNLLAMPPAGSGVDNESTLRENLAEQQPAADSTKLNAYPNPTNDLISIEAGEPILEVFIYSLSGELVQTRGAVNELSLGELPAGTYFIVARTVNGIKRVPVIKE